MAQKNESNDNRKIYISLIGNILLALGSLIEWVIKPHYFSELVRNSTMGTIILGLLTVSMITGSVLYWKGYEKGKIKDFIDHFIYAILPLVSGVFLLLLVLIFTQEQAVPGAGGDPPPNSVLTYRLKTLQQDISDKAYRAVAKIRKIKIAIEEADDNQEILHLEKQKAGLEYILDRLSLLKPSVEDLSYRIGQNANDNTTIDPKLKEQLEEYEKLLNETRLD